MPGGFPPHLVDEIRTRVDIVELVGQFVTLKRVGENWKGLCPFHTEKTPSFHVNPKRGIFHCFGCGVGGDAFAFLMRQDRLSFPEAVRALAQRYGVELPEARRDPGAESRLETLRRIMALAAEFYREQLWGHQGVRARRYIEGRGIDPEVARRFGLGYAPEGWNVLLGHMARQGIDEEVLVQAGLALPRQTGEGCYDRFRARLLFPIRDLQGRVVAFGGRALSPGEEPKYLNSPETPLYVKGQMLYALDIARQAMRERNRAIIVEGYLDCLMAHQHGFTETVAALGTSFTPAQLGLLRRYTDEVLAVFDADAAGERAAARLEEMMPDVVNLQSLGWSVTRSGSFERPGYFPIKVALLPEGHDPDSLLRAEGAAALEARLQAARPVLSFVLEKALAEEDLSTARGRAAAHARAALVLSKVANAEEATLLAREAARRLGVDATQLWIEAQQLQGARSRRPDRRAELAGQPSGSPWPTPSLSERDLLALLLHVEEARAELLPVLKDEDIAHPGLRLILAGLRQAPDGAAEQLMGRLEGEAEKSLLAALLLEERQWADINSQVFELKKRYDIRRRKKRLRQVTQAIAQAQAAGDPALAALEEELRNLQRDIQREAEAIRELTLARPAPPSAPPLGP
jgi:DNA primase